MIFLLAFSLYLEYVFVDPSEGDFSIVQREAVRLSDSLLSEGFPKDWNDDLTKATRIGLLDENNVLDINKLNNYSYIAADTYYDSKILTGIENDYLVIIGDKNISGINFPNNEDDVLDKYEAVAVQRRILQKIDTGDGRLETINMTVYVYR